MVNTIENYNMSSVFRPEVGDMFFAYLEDADMSVRYLTCVNRMYQFTSGNIGSASLFNSKEDMQTIPFNKAWYHSAKSINNATVVQVKDIFEPHYVIRTHNKLIELAVIWNIKEDGVIEKTQPSDKGGTLRITNDFYLAESILREIKVDRLETINKEYFKLREIKFEKIIK